MYLLLSIGWMWHCLSLSSSAPPLSHIATPVAIQQRKIQISSLSLSLLTTSVGPAVKFRSHQSLHLFQLAWLIAQWLERLPCKQEIWVRFPVAPILFGPRVLAHPCNPSTWRSRSDSRWDECDVGWVCPELPPPSHCNPSYNTAAKNLDFFTFTFN